ncbi:MAG: DUF368 domain-containing protein [Candidatus Margulisbacteria bacterium]|nr:DUF368 domain-containing protein [Candidatus Margulisiibacteriota bacterium]
MKTILKGTSIGIANIIPGISGGTVAVILNIYDQLIESTGEFFQNKNKRKEYIIFLSKIMVGAGIGILLFSRVIGFLLADYVEVTSLVFIGFILGSIPAIYKSHSGMKMSVWGILIFCVSFISIAMLAQLSPNTGSEVHMMTGLKGYGYLVLSGFIAAGTMVIPGVSGSMILILLGTYSVVINAVSTLHVPVILAVSLGAIVGLFVCAKSIDICLKAYPSEAYFAIFGLILGSTVKLWPGLVMPAQYGWGSLIIACTMSLVFLVGRSPKKTSS